MLNQLGPTGRRCRRKDQRSGGCSGRHREHHQRTGDQLPDRSRGRGTAGLHAHRSFGRRHLDSGWGDQPPIRLSRTAALIPFACALATSIAPRSTRSRTPSSTAGAGHTATLGLAGYDRRVAAAERDSARKPATARRRHRPPGGLGPGQRDGQGSPDGGLACICPPQYAWNTAAPTRNSRSRSAICCGCCCWRWRWSSACC